LECLKCGDKENLHCHHNYYIGINYLGEENISDIDYLCGNCHENWHSIQKNLGTIQNNLVNRYFAFVFQDVDENKMRSSLNIISKKISLDNIVISNFFRNDDVVKYEKYNNMASLLFIASVILIFFYGIGIITLIVTFVIASKNNIPVDYKLFEEKKSAIRIKEAIIRSLLSSKI